MHSYWMPLTQDDHRCPGCGLSWQRDGARAVHHFPEAPAHLEADAEGWFHCCPDRQFRWGQPLFYTIPSGECLHIYQDAPAVPVTITGISVYTIE